MTMEFLKLITILSVFQAVTWIATAKKCKLNKADVVLVLDESSSIWPDSYKQQKQFVKHMIDDLDIGADKIKLGILSFATGAKERFNLNTYHNKADMKSEVSGFKQITGDTHTWEAMKLARTLTFNPKFGGRPGKVPQIAIVITDGNSQEPLRTKHQSKLTRDSGVTVFAIGVGRGINFAELLNIAGSNDTILRVDDYNDLVKKQTKIFESACEAIPMDEGICPNADVSFVMDTPNAKQIDLVEANEFMRVITKDLEIASDKTRIASVANECMQLASFHLNEHKTNEEVLRVLQFDKKSKSDISSLLSKARGHIFSGKNGARTDAKKVILLVTDGKPGDLSKLSSEGMALEAGNFEVFVIGVGDNVDAVALKRVATDEKHYISVPNYESLRSTKDALITAICKRPSAEKEKRTFDDLFMELRSIIDERQ